MRSYYNAVFAIFLFLFSLLDYSLLLGQQPGLHFEAIARDRNNNPARDRRIFVRAAIIQTASTTIPVFEEEHIAQTSKEGIFQIVIGKGTRVGGTHASLFEIPWRTFNYSLNIQIAIEPVLSPINWNYQNEWVDIGTTPFGIVPFAGVALMAEQISSNAAVLSFSGGVTGLTPVVPSQGNVVLGGTLAISNGGTGSAVKNFVDLNTSQEVNGSKIFLNTLEAREGISISNALSLLGNATPIQLNNQSGSFGDVLISQGANATPRWISVRSMFGIKSKNRSGSLTATEVYTISVAGLDSDDGISVLVEVDTVPKPIPNYYIYRDVPNGRVEVHFTAPFTGFITWVIID